MACAVTVTTGNPVSFDRIVAPGFTLDVRFTVDSWGNFAQRSAEPDFGVRNGLDAATLVDLFGWGEAEFRQRLAGSAIFRIGHERWLRNLAVAIGNALHGAAQPELAAQVRTALSTAREGADDLVREHIDWALAQ